MKIKTGYLYHIKDEFFDIINDENLMQNHERGKKRPTYFTIKDKDILWFIPLSSKIEKYGVCNTILIREIKGIKHAILLQNAFPTLEKYIDHVHTQDGIPVKVVDSLKYEILDNFELMLKLKNKGINLFFTDIDKIKGKILEELLIHN